MVTALIVKSSPMSSLALAAMAALRASIE